MAGIRYREDFIRYMRFQFGVVQEYALTEIVPTLGIHIHVCPPTADRDYSILFTTGMSDRPQAVPEGCDEYRYTELLTLLPADWPMDQQALRDPNNFWPFEWLRRIAAYPHENGTWLGGPHTIISASDPPVPLAPNTKLSCFLLLRVPDWGTVEYIDGRLMILYQVIPLYTEERDLELRSGVRELLTRFDSRAIPLIVDPARPNVAVEE